MKYLSIDIETYSDNDLIKGGVYKYVDTPNFEILLFAYAFDDEPVEIIDLKNGEVLPDRVLNALNDKTTIKTAYNANFERTCIQKHFGIKLDYSSWLCTMVWGNYVGLPSGLDNIAKILNLGEQKDAKGKNLIKYFSIPCKPTKVNGGRTRNLPNNDLEKWQKFKDYCVQDVEVERDLRKYLSKYNFPKSEKILWLLDQKINDTGVKIDLEFINKVIKIDELNTSANNERLKELTNLDNPNSVVQLKGWLSDRLGYEIESLSKDALQNILDTTDDELVKEDLTLRKENAKTSVKKYDAMQRCVCSDKRVRGLLQFYGANRTGRWAGRLVQVQNLPQNHLENIEKVRTDFKTLNFKTLKANYYSIPKTLSELIRTAFIPSNSNRFIVSDFSAIEARVVAYLADEKWRIDVFNTHGKIYEASASQMFNIPIEQITKGSDLRQKGKIAELALGYGGGVNALESMGASKMGLDKNELQPLVNAWRNSNPNIKNFWYDCERASKQAIRDYKITTLENNITFYMNGSNLCIQLPSKRTLYYNSAEIGINKYGSESITYMSMNQTTKRWQRTDTFGGKLVENIVQAYARDCLAESLKRINKLGFKIVFHVHDEVVIDCPKGVSSADEIAKIMSEPIEWAKGLPLNADAYECDFYMKD